MRLQILERRPTASHTTAETACFAPVPRTQNRVGRSDGKSRYNPESAEGCGLANDCRRIAETAGAKWKAIMVEMAKLWGECAEDAERGTKDKE